MQTLPLARETENFVKKAAKTRLERPQPAEAKPPKTRRLNAYESIIGSSEFRKWFGNSKVVFKQGESDYFQNPEGVCGTPRVVYHGANLENNLDILRSDEHGAIWFRSDRSKAERLAGEKSAVIPAFLRIENGLELGADNFSTIGAAIEEAKAGGNDGLFLRSGAGDYTYAVFSPEQVKCPLTDQFPDRGAIEPKRQDCGEPQKGFASRYGCGLFPPDSEEGAPGKKAPPSGTKPFQALGKRIESLSDLASFAAQLKESGDGDPLYVFLDRGAIIDPKRGGRHDWGPSAKKIAGWASELARSPCAPLLIYLGVNKEVCGLQQIHPHDFSDISFTRRQMENKLLGFGAIGAVALLPQRVSQNILDAARYYVQAHILDCAIGFCGQSAYFLGQLQPDRGQRLK
jgi:hypothetical protein